MNLLMEEDGEYAPVMEAAALSAASRKELDDATAYAASKSGATSDQIVTWIDAFTSLGKPGLMAAFPFRPRIAQRTLMVAGSSPHALAAVLRQPVAARSIAIWIRPPVAGSS
jgi:hypothetical protein